MNQRKYDMWNAMWGMAEHPDKNNVYHKYSGFGHFCSATALFDNDCVFALMMKYAKAEYYSNSNLIGAVLGRQKVCQQTFGGMTFKNHASEVIDALNACCTNIYGLSHDFLNILSDSLNEKLRGKDINENGDLFALLTVIKEKTNREDLFPFMQSSNTPVLAQARYA